MKGGHKRDEQAEKYKDFVSSSAHTICSRIEKMAYFTYYKYFTYYTYYTYLSLLFFGEKKNLENVIQAMNMTCSYAMNGQFKS